MKYLNKYNLPDAIVRAISNDSYTGPRNSLDNISVTTLINPPRIHFLKIKHWNDIEEDVSDGLWRLLGSAVHAVLERSESKDSQTIKEERLSESIDGITVSGAIDVLGTDTIEDYKCTSVYSYIFEPNGKPEWIQQLNIYRWLARKIFDINSLKINMILRDHQSSNARRDPSYPQIPFVSINLSVWPIEETEKYIKERVALFKICRELPEDKMPLCTPGEMWEKPTTYAIVRPGLKKAVKVCDSIEETKKYMGKGESIEIRHGCRNRCDSYCLVNKWCSQYQDYLKSREKK